NGAVYADLDNDGDLDLITNNIDQEVIVYENTTDARTQHHYLRLVPAEPGANIKIWVHSGGRTQFIETTPYRGFQSSVEKSAHFGLGDATQADSVVILWPDSLCRKYFSLAADTTVVFS